VVELSAYPLKIIHASEISLIKEIGDEKHELELLAEEENENLSIEWEYFDGRVDLFGEHQKNKWHMELFVEEFSEAVLEYVTEYESRVDSYHLYKP